MEIIILLGLILLNGLFSMSEIALVSARKARLEGQANRGDDRARKALELSNRPDTFLSTVQIGITLIGIMTGIFSGKNIHDDIMDFLNRWEWMRPYSDGTSTVVVVVIVTFFSLVLGELVPKRIGLSHPEAIAKAVAAPMKLLGNITHPFIWLLTRTTGLIVRIFNIQANENQVTEEEIKAIISEGTEHGAIEEAEQEIIERVFHLGDRNITSLMTHRTDIVWLKASQTVREAREKIIESPHSAYPVCENQLDHISGLVHIKDLFQADGNTAMSEFMKPALFVPEGISAYQVLEKFKESKIHHCFIVDEYGSLQGMITLNDILEAIVGEIPMPDEEMYEITDRKDGSFLIDGQIPFYDFLSYFEKTEWMNEGEQEFDTLAGFILHILEHIPKTGETLEWKDFKFEIVDMDVHRIDKVLVTVGDR